MDALIVLLSALPIDFNFARPMLLLLPLTFLLTRGAPLSVRLFLIYFMASWCFSVTSIDMGPETYRQRYNALFNLVLVMGPVLLVAYGRTITLYRIVRLCALITALVSVWQFAHGQEAVGTWVNPMVNGTFLALAASLGGFGWPLLALCAMLTKSSMACATAVVVVLLKVKIDRELKLVLALCLGALAYLLAGTGDTGRFHLWELCLPLLKSNWLLGVGFGSIAQHLQAIQTATGHMLYPVNIDGIQAMAGYFENTHNMFLEVLLSGGIVGLALFAWVLLNAYVHSKQENRRALLACLVCSLGCPIFAYSLTAIIFMLVLKRGRGEQID